MRDASNWDQNLADFISDGYFNPEFSSFLAYAEEFFTYIFLHTCYWLPECSFHEKRYCILEHLIAGILPIQVVNQRRRTRSHLLTDCFIISQLFSADDLKTWLCDFIFSIFFFSHLYIYIYIYIYIYYLWQNMELTRQNDFLLVFFFFFFFFFFSQDVLSRNHQFYFLSCSDLPTTLSFAKKLQIKKHQRL